MILSLLVCLLACQPAETTVELDSPDTSELLPRVRITTVEEQTFVRTLSLPSTIYAVRSAILVPKVQGRIESVSVQIGDVVNKGDVLMRIEDNDYEAGFLEAKATYELAIIQATQAQTTAERFAKLYEENAIAKSQWEEMNMGAQLANGQATRAKAGLDIATNRLQETSLKSPFNGVIIAKNITEGEMLGGATNRPPLQIADLSSVHFRASVGETDAITLTDNQKGTLEIPGKQHSIPITLSRINQAVDPVVKTVTVEGLIDNSSHQLKHNQSATLHLDIEESALAIPRQALLNRKSQAATVFVLKGSVVEKRLVQYGRSETDYVPVYSGIQQVNNY